ncbi:TetR/AcrR family transcriptional regulator [Actinomadura hibisca]|uniref:TetR/AcrR family transcriptional regulator n=1 Tax=Actinomadura hibisca TaxID=68565 RepID=UPI0008300405|nr:TetR family transcriptional regulator [Actinomadura hibisca]
MGRPPRHDEDTLLDAAVALAAEHGPGGVTVTAVARAAGAPSGSVYHRFPSAAALTAALWLRTLERFQEGVLDALRHSPEHAARHVVAWCRTHPAEARILLYGGTDFGEAGWPPEARDRLRAANARLADALGSDERLLLAVVDVPYAIVRRHLRATGTIPAAAEDLAAEAAAALLPD